MWLWNPNTFAELSVLLRSRDGFFLQLIKFGQWDYHSLWVTLEGNFKAGPHRTARGQLWGIIWSKGGSLLQIEKSFFDLISPKESFRIGICISASSEIRSWSPEVDLTKTCQIGVLSSETFKEEFQNPRTPHWNLVLTEENSLRNVNSCDLLWVKPREYNLRKEEMKSGLSTSFIGRTELQRSE